MCRKQGQTGPDRSGQHGTAAGWNGGGPSGRRAGRLVAALVVCGAVLGLLPVAARAATPLPPFPRKGVAVAGTADTLEPLRAFLAHFRSAVGARYHVAVVGLSDPDDRTGGDYSDSAVSYVDQLYEAWREKVDPATGVVVVMAVENRGIALHPGSRWTKLGVEQDEITKIIDASPFAVNARSGDYAAALIGLVKSVDGELASRSAAAAEAERELAGKLPGLEGRVQALQPQIEAMKHANESLLTRTAEIGAALARSREAMAEERWVAARDRARQAEQLVQRLEAEVPEVAAWRKEQDELSARRFPEVTARLLRVEALPVPGGGTPGRWLADELTRARQSIRAAAAARNEQDFKAAVRELEGADLHLGLAEHEHERSVREHHFRTVVLPTAGAIVLVVLLGIVALALAARRALRRRLAEKAVKSWADQLGQAGERLVALANDHPYLFGTEGLAERFTGKTAEFYRTVGVQVDDLYAKYERAQELLARARQELAGVGWPGSGGFVRVARMLDDQEVEVGTETVKEHRLFLPEHRVVRMKAFLLLENMDKTYGEARTHLSELELALTERAETLARIQAAEARVEAACLRLEEAGTVVAVYRQALAQERTTATEVAREASADPLSCAEAAAAQLARTDGLAQRLQRAEEALQLLDTEVGPRLAATLAEVERLRTVEGLQVQEPGFEPEALADRVRATERRARRALAAGEDLAAEELALQAAAQAEELAGLVADTVTSRQESPRRIANGRAALAALRSQLPERRRRITGLRAAYDDAALQPALDNAEEADAALAGATAGLAEAEAALTPEQQRFLAAAELVRRAEETAGQVEELYEEIEQKAAALAQALQQADVAAAEAGRRLQQMQALLAAGQAFATEASLQAVPRLSHDLDVWQALRRAERPHPPALLQAAQQLQAGAQADERRLTQERTAWSESTGLLPRLEEQLLALAARLAASEDDRPPANERRAAAAQSLEQARQQIAPPPARTDWVAVRSCLAVVEEALADATRLAEEDFSAARAAREAIAAAVARQQAADTSYGWGVQADLGSTRRALDTARARLAERDYAEALKRAQEARREAELAESRAKGAAGVKAAAAAERSRSSRSSWSSSSSWSRSSSSSRKSSSSSSSSRSSSSSSRSSSGGSSFRSSSGGSSYRSSSGGSRVGSSSGGSKW